MKKIILIIALLTNPLIAMAVTLDTDMPGVVLKNFQCASNSASFNVVNKSDKTISYLYVNIFDSANDPVDRIYVFFGSLPGGSGTEYKGKMDCSKLARIGITVQH